MKKNMINLINRYTQHNHVNGFAMIILLAITTVLGLIATTTVNVDYKTRVEREKELELIFRGEAIAKALTKYKELKNVYPSNLEDLINIDIYPPILRDLYKDPMTILDSRYHGKWNLIYSDNGTEIIGVKSFSTKDSKICYQNEYLTSSWNFLAQLNFINK